MRIALNHFSHRPSHWRAWMLLSLIVTVLTSIPFSLYITDQHATLLLMMIQVMVGAQFIVSIHTLLVVNATFARLRQMTGNMDLLQLTGVDAHTLIFGNWQAIIQKTALPHLLLVLPKLGLVLGIAQFLHIAQRSDCHPVILDMFCYLSHNSWNGYHDVYFWNPTLIQFLSALAILLLCTYAEVRLLVALGVWINLTHLKRPDLLLVLPLFIRIGIIALAVVGVIQIQLIRDQFQMRWRSDISCYDEEGGYDSTSEGEQWCQETIHRTNVIRMLDIAQVAVFSLTDNVVMLSASIMRPNLSRYYTLEAIDFRPLRAVTSYNQEVGVIQYRNSQWKMSAWRFIFRMFASAALVLLLYGILTYILLYSAQRLAIRRGFLSAQ